MIFSSSRPRLEIPESITNWDFILNSKYAPLGRPASELAGFTNAATKERVRFDEVKEYATLISTALVKNHGFQKGDTVALFSPNTVWYPVAMIAVTRVGGIVSAASPAYGIEEMTYALKTSQSKMIMTVPSSMDVAIPAAQKAGIPRERIFLLEGEKEGYTTVKQLLDQGKSYGASGQVPPFKIPPGQTNKDICGFLCFSSGTTGLPKAVMISHRNVIAQCLQVHQETPEDYKKILAVTPLYHITGLVHQMHMPFILNAEVYMLPSFTMKSMLDAVVEFKISELLLVPPIVIRVVHDPIVKQYDLSHIKRFASGAAPISAEVIQKLEKQFPGTGFTQAYGMTESCSCITKHPAERTEYKYAKRGGTIVANTEVKIIDKETGAELSYNEEGEILARGPQVVMGYLNNEKATRETFDEDGWLHTGDVGFVDREGFINITDRIKEMIKVKGIGVSPAELEDLLLGHPKVEDVGVTSIADDYSGERPKAYIVPKPEARKGDLVALGQELIEFVKTKKIRTKWIVAVEFVDEVPKSAAGKILRRVLRDMEKNNTGRKSLVVKDERARARL